GDTDRRECAVVSGEDPHVVVEPDHARGRREQVVVGERQIKRVQHWSESETEQPDEPRCQKNEGDPVVSGTSSLRSHAESVGPPYSGRDKRCRRAHYSSSSPRRASASRRSPNESPRLFTISARAPMSDAACANARRSFRHG